MKSKWLPTFPLHAANWLADPRVQMLPKVDRCDLLEALLRSWMLGKSVAVNAQIADAYGELWPEYEVVRNDHHAAYDKRVEQRKAAAEARWSDASRNAGRMRAASEPQCEPVCESQCGTEGTPTITRTISLTRTRTPTVIGRRGTRLPDDTVLTGEWVEIAERHGVRDVDAAFTEFVNYWTSLPGQRATKLDWTKTWENQCIKLGRPNRSERPRTAAAETMSNVREFLEDSGATFGR